MFKENVVFLGGTIVGEYVKSDKPIECRCARGHECSPTPSKLHQGQGMCGPCSNGSAEAAIRFIAKMKELKYILFGEYKNARTHIRAECPEGHECWVLPTKVMSNRGGLCTQCSMTIGERVVAAVLRELGVGYEIQTSFSGSDMTFDFCLDGLDIKVEFDGGQHFEQIPNWRLLVDEHANDVYKTRLCLEKGFKIIRLHFSVLKGSFDLKMFIQQAIASEERLIVSHREHYGWLYHGLW